MDPLALGGQAVAQAASIFCSRPSTLLQSVAVSRVSRRSRLPQGLAQVGEAEAVLRPLAPQQGAGETPPKRFSKAFAWLSDNPFCRRLPVTPKVSMHLPRPRRGARYFSSQAICPGWPARASWVMVSTALDRRSIDSGTRAWASSRVACRGLLPVRQERWKRSSSASGETRTFTEEMIPKRPSEPSTSSRRSGPAADAGKVAISSGPAKVSRVPPAKSCSIRRIAQRRPLGGWRPSHRGSTTPRTAGNARACSQRTQLALHLRAGGARGRRSRPGSRGQIEQAVRRSSETVSTGRRGLADVIWPAASTAAAIGNQLRVAGVGQGQQLADLLGGFRIATASG